MCKNGSTLEASFDAFRLSQVTGGIVKVLLRGNVEIFQALWHWEYFLFSEHGLRFSAKDLNIRVIVDRLLLFDLVKWSEQGLGHHSRTLVLDH